MGKRICAACDWYSRETMSCKNENSIICAAGERDRVPIGKTMTLSFGVKRFGIPVGRN